MNYRDTDDREFSGPGSDHQERDHEASERRYSEFLDREGAHGPWWVWATRATHQVSIHGAAERANGDDGADRGRPAPSAPAPAEPPAAVLPKRRPA